MGGHTKYDFGNICDFDNNIHAEISGQGIYSKKNGYILVDSDSGYVRIAQYSYNSKKASYFKIKNPLENYGGFHVGKDGNYYIAFGTSQKDKTTDKIFQVNKYNSKWKKIGSVSWKKKDVNVEEMFQSGDLNMDDNNGTLVIHTARLRLKSQDGLNHQSNFTVHIDMKNMKKIYTAGDFPSNHVGHSFNQRIKFDDDKIVYLDHGDAYPRSFVLQVEGTVGQVKKLELFGFSGSIGENHTGAFLGGFEVSKTNYIMVAHSVDQDKQYGRSFDATPRNVFLCIASKEGIANTEENGVSSSESTTKYLTNYTKKNSEKPCIIKMSDDRYCIMWEEYKYNQVNPRIRTEKYLDTKYVIIDGNGKRITKNLSIKGVRMTSLMDPIFNNGKIIWVHQGNNKKKLIRYELDVKKYLASTKDKG